MCLPGDVAILLSAGWSPLKVLIFQLVSASTAFIGLYVGIGASEGSEVVQQWIFIVAAGMFLYVALTDVVGITTYSASFTIKNIWRTLKTKKIT